MQDPWKYLAFPIAAVAGYVAAQTTIATVLQNSIGLNTMLANVAVVAITGFIAGFTMDELIPAYIEKRRNGGGSGSSSSEGGGDFDFE